MRWLNTSTFHLLSFESPPTSYVTLSYLPGDNDRFFEDLSHQRSQGSKPGFRVLQNACLQACNLGYLWLWCGTACIDTGSSAELTESINSIAQIYRDCELCLIYLDELSSSPSSDEEIGLHLSSCGWTQNVWTIPHIIFSKVAYFYNCDWIRVGSKCSLLPRISSALGIDEVVLEDPDCLADYSIGKRMSWACEARASRVEDIAYALLGIFDVNMPILYGEGRKAFLKLQEELLKDSNDYSLFAWQSQSTQEYRGIYAQSPAEFQHFRTLPKTPFTMKGELQLHCAGVTIHATLHEVGHKIFLPLECPGKAIYWIALSQWKGGIFVRCVSLLEQGLGGTLGNDVRRVCVKRDVTTRELKRALHQDNLQQSREGFTEPSKIVSATSQDVSRLGMDSTAWSMEDVVPNHPWTVSEPGMHGSPRESSIIWSAHAHSSGSVTAFGLNDHENVHWTNGGGTCTSLPCGDRLVSLEKNDPDSSSSVETEMDRPNASNISEVNLSLPTTNTSLSLDLARLTNDMTDFAVAQFLSRYRRSSVKRPFMNWSTHHRKRARTNRSSSNMDVEDSSNPEDEDTVIVRHRRSRLNTFLCPFYLRDKDKHKTCLIHHQLLSTREVRDHLCVSHREPIYCPICKEQFLTSRTRDDHIRSRSCTLGSAHTFDGIADWQAEQFVKEDTSSLSEESQWFRIWDTVFPQTQRPASPFAFAAEELGICGFRNFWTLHGQSIISDYLKSTSVEVDTMHNEERTLSDLYQSVLKRSEEKVFDELAHTTNTSAKS